MRGKFKSKTILLPSFINLTEQKVYVKKTNLFVSLNFLKEHFFLYNGFHYVLTRVRLPFSFVKLYSFIQSKPKFDLIPTKFKRIAMKKTPKKKQK